MFKSTLLRFAALTLVLSLLLIPVSAVAAPADAPIDSSPRFEERRPVVEAVWGWLVQAWQKTSSSISPNGKS